MNLALNRLQAGAFPVADSLLRLARQEAISLNDSMDLAQTGWMLMNVLSMTGRQDSAISIGREVLRIPPTGSLRPIIELVRLDQAIAYMGNGDVDSADHLFRAGLSSDWVQNNPHIWQSGAVNYAELKTNQGDLAGALDLLLAAETRLAALGDTLQLAVLKMNMGSLLAALHRPEEALVAYADARKYAMVVGMQDISTTSQGLMALLKLKGDLHINSTPALVGEASIRSDLIVLQKALGAARANGNQRFVDLFLTGIGSAFLRLGDLHRARVAVDSALWGARDRRDRSVLREALLVSGDIDVSQGLLREADHAYSEALQICRDVGEKQQTIRTLDRLAHVYEASGRSGSALAAIKEAKDIQLQLFTDSTMNEVARLEARSAFERKQLADSLAHVQQLALERAEAQARIDRQHTRTLAAMGGGAVLLMGGGVAFAMDRRRRQARFAQQAAELEREAARFETQALRSQMNPHFIFNALNSIAGYVQGNDPDRAQSFLARFAKLMRAVLENSRVAEVALARDLEVLRAYMELERVRAQGKFSYTITVAPDVDAEAVLVPPLLAQPFVENAIWHGVAGKQGEGHIAVHVERAEGQLRIRVEDDGVGRAQQRSAVSKEKTSLGTAITRSRLDLVEKQKGAPAGFRYVEVPVGTRVEIHLPLELAA
ncbi:MAG: histidine kinase [Flavobacteriales bacterium]|nr:histidine kinase [Flavobacteriales bacterium]